MEKLSIENVYELSDFLKEKLGDRYEFKRRVTGGVMEGYLDGVEFTVAIYAHRQLVVSTGPGTSRETVDKLVPYLNMVMDNNGPICRFGLVTYGIENDPPMPHLEWNIVNPDERLKELANNRGVGERAGVIDFEVLNGKNISDYLDTEEERAEMMKNARIYGIDSGTLIPSMIASLSESDIYLFIRNMEREISKLSQFQVLGVFVCKGLDDMKYSLDYLKQQTTRFGVEMPTPALEKRVNETESYNKWYKFYEDHFAEFTNDQWIRFRDKRNANEDVSEFLPATSWKDSINMTLKPNDNQE